MGFYHDGCLKRRNVNLDEKERKLSAQIEAEECEYCTLWVHMLTDRLVQES